MNTELGKNKLAKACLLELREVLTNYEKNTDNFFSLEQLLEELEKNCNLSFDYPIPDSRNLFQLHLVSLREYRNLALQIQHPLLTRNNFYFELDFDLKGNQCSIHTNSEYLDRKINQMMIVEYGNYNPHHRGENPFLTKLKQHIYFRQEYFPVEIRERLSQDKPKQKIKSANN